MEYDKLGNPKLRNHKGYHLLRNRMWKDYLAPVNHKAKREYIPSEQRAGFDAVEIERIPAVSAKPVYSAKDMSGVHPKMAVY